MKIAFPSNTEKSKDTFNKLKEELILRKLNCEWQEDSEGLFGLMKHKFKWKLVSLNRTSLWCYTISEINRKITQKAEPDLFGSLRREV